MKDYFAKMTRGYPETPWMDTSTHRRHRRVKVEISSRDGPQSAGSLATCTPLAPGRPSSSSPARLRRKMAMPADGLRLPARGTPYQAHCSAMTISLR